MTVHSPKPRIAIDRQIRLPLRKAIEIAWKGLRVRLGRSLLVTSGIVLALAFLMSTLVTEAVVDGMRHWAREGPAAESFQRQQLDSLLAARGVATTPKEVADERLQNRWLLGVALLVAFVGILNAMLMSVTERFREIGTMKCLGALDGFIVKLFLLESLFQGVVGTALGVVIGLVVSMVNARFAYGTFAWRGVRPGELFVAAVLSFATGLALSVAGAVYPAWHASRMQPIEAMRVET